MYGLCGIYTRDGARPELHVLAGTSWASEAQAIQIVFDGRIYNRAELTRELAASGAAADTSSEPAIIAGLYANAGIDGLHKLRGVFSFALLDPNRDCFYLVRDRLGVKPLYYTRVAQSVVFASRVTSIFSVSGVPPHINLQALPYFLLGVRNPPSTIFEGILTLAPGHYLLIKKDQERVREYWDVKFPERRAERIHPASHYADELHALLAETVKLYTADADETTALLLSGGLDSSVLGCLAGDVPGLRTYAIAFKSPQYRAFDESGYARFVAEHIGSRHTEFDYQRVHVNAYFLDTLRQSECPTYPREIQSMIPFYLISRRMRRDGIKIVLTGLGADEILGGYQHHQVERIRRCSQARPDRSASDHLYRKIIGWRGEDRYFFEGAHDEILRTYGHNLASLMSIKGLAYVRENLTNVLAEDVVTALGPEQLTGRLQMGLDPARYRRFHPFDQSLYLDIKTRLVDCILLEEHQIAGAFGLEPRLPYLDHRVVEYVATIPPTVKMRGLTEKYVLKEVARHYFPADFFQRTWRGFAAPFATEVFGNPRSLLVAELLSPAALKRTGYLRPSFVRALLEQYRHERNPTVKAACEFLLERALLIQGIDYVFVRKAWWPARLASLWTRLLREQRRL